MLRQRCHDSGGVTSQSARWDSNPNDGLPGPRQQCICGARKCHVARIQWPSNHGCCCRCFQLDIHRVLQGGAARIPGSNSHSARWAALAIRFRRGLQTCCPRCDPHNNSSDDWEKCIYRRRLGAASRRSAVQQGRYDRHLALIADRENIRSLRP